MEQPSLLGAWVGEDDTGEHLTLVFGGESKFDLIDDSGESVSKSLEEGASFEFETVPQVEPAQLYLRLLQDEKVLTKEPFAVYKFEEGKLILCWASGKQATYMGMPIGGPQMEFPSSYSGSCSVFSREPS